MKHIHHIKPKHMGGTNEPSNLVELTVEEHADAHLELFKQYGKEEDYIAWLALSGQISKQEAILMTRKLGRKITDKKLEEKYGVNWRSELSKLGSAKGIEAQRKYGVGFFNPVNQANASRAALSKQAKAKRKSTFRKIGHQQGKKNSNFGKCWISDMAKEQSILIPKTELESYLVTGWIKGRRFIH